MTEILLQKLVSTSGDNLDSSRISRESMFMLIARIISLRGTCNRGGRTGAVIVKDNRIVSMGYAGSPPGLPHCLDLGCDIDEITGGCIRTQHAEANAIAWAAREGIAVRNTIMYVTLQPCLSCAKMVVMAGIKSVLYHTEYRDNRGSDYLKAANVSILRFSKIEME